MLSFECIKNEKSVYFLLTSALNKEMGSIRGVEGAVAQNHARGMLIE